MGAIAPIFSFHMFFIVLIFPLGIVLPTLVPFIDIAWKIIPDIRKTLTTRNTDIQRIIFILHTMHEIKTSLLLCTKLFEIRTSHTRILFRKIIMRACFDRLWILVFQFFHRFSQVTLPRRDPLRNSTLSLVLSD